ncbi:uncharacterized protein [Syngnathus scovelli]|uniref:uncharacterized protein isoform X4 n=1 Tax=Syngnathus scovelli TaxID=161590 RepID=UPI00210F66D3|nr:uncharacterized protein LOC125988752 isoform X4 [Syngnathus scovelli]
MVPVVLLLYSLGHVDLGINSSGAMNHRYLWMFLFSSFVSDNVTKPNISCKMVDQNQAFLECLTEGKSDPLLKFKWRSQGTEQTGPILKINLSDEQDVYHCDVSNPLTNETASFLAKDCFLNKIPQDGILISTDMTSLLVTGITGIVSGFILGYIVRRKFQCSELFKIIRAKYFERQKTTEAANPKLLKEKRSFNSEPKQPPISQEKQNLGSGEDARDEDLSQTQELDS